MADSGQNEGSAQARAPRSSPTRRGRGRTRVRKGHAKGQGMVEATVRSRASSTPATADTVRTGMEAQRRPQTVSVRRGDHNLQIHSDQQHGGPDQLETAQQQGGQVQDESINSAEHQTTREQHGAQLQVQRHQGEKGQQSPETALNLGDCSSETSSDDFMEEDDSFPDLSDSRLGAVGTDPGGFDITNDNTRDGHHEQF